MWTRRQLLLRGGLTLLGAAGTCFALPGDNAPKLPEEPEALPDGSAVRGLMTRKTDEALDRALAYLYSHRNANGSFGTNAYEGNSAVTALSALAFMGAGHQPHRGVYGKAVAGAVKFVLELDRRSGQIGFLHNPDATPYGPMYGHGFATLFLAEVSGMVHDRALRKQVHEKLRQAVQVIFDAQTREGGWRYDPRPNDADLSVTVCQIMALRAARNAGVFVPKNKVKECIDYVLRCQDRLGGWFRYQANGAGNGTSQSFARTAAGVSALNSAGIYRNDREHGEAVEKGLKFLLAHKPSSPVRGSALVRADMHYFYGQYYAVQAMWTAGGSYWATWYPYIRDELLESQRAEGIWMDAICPHYATAMACIILQVPNNYLPILQK
jgi:hypothetical protein